MTIEQSHESTKPTVFAEAPFKSWVDPKTKMLATKHRKRIETLTEYFERRGWTSAHGRPVLVACEPETDPTGLALGSGGATTTRFVTWGVPDETMLRLDMALKKLCFDPGLVQATAQPL